MTDSLGRDYGTAPCGTCGTKFERTNANSCFCSPQCKPSVSQRRRCALCAEWFMALRASARTRRKFGDQFTRCCSKSCAIRLGAIERNPSSPWPNPAMQPNDCLWCGRTTGSPRRTFCSRACNDMVSDPRRSQSTPIEYRDCRECGGLFVSRVARDKVYCSEACSARTIRRDRRHRERAAGMRLADSITLREVAERDGWQCHLCGKQVPDRPSRSRPTDPTIDHLIPLSDNGQHTWDNVALAHFQCNWQRGATGPAQLRLTA